MTSDDIRDDSGDDITAKTEVKFGDRTTVAGSNSSQSSLDQVFDAKTVVRVSKPAPQPVPEPVEVKPAPAPAYVPAPVPAPAPAQTVAATALQDAVTNPIVTPIPTLTPEPSPEPIVAKVREAKKLKKVRTKAPKPEIEDPFDEPTLQQSDNSHIWLAGGMAAIAITALIVLFLHGQNKASVDHVAQENLASEAPGPATPSQHPVAPVPPKVRGEQDVLREFEQSFQQARSQTL